jgi:DNA-binding GntR family transcriptional regulator
MPVQRGTPVPPSRQIAAILREQITSGQLAPDARLPSRLQLAAEHGVSQETAAKAINILRDEGLVVVVASYGAFVARP